MGVVFNNAYVTRTDFSWSDFKPGDVFEYVTDEGHSFLYLRIIEDTVGHVAVSLRHIHHVPFQLLRRDYLEGDMDGKLRRYQGSVVFDNSEENQEK